MRDNRIQRSLPLPVVEGDTLLEAPPNKTLANAAIPFNEGWLLDMVFKAENK